MFKMNSVEFLQNTGQFIFIDSNSLIHGKNIESWLQINPEYLFLLTNNIAGKPEDLVKFVQNTDTIAGINKDNIIEAKEWISYYKSLIPSLSYPVTFNYSLLDINILKNNIMKELNITPNFETIPNILNKLFHLYDQEFFNNRITKIIEEKNIKLDFCYNEKMTKTGGRCSKHKDEYKISISQQIILNTFKNGEKCHISNGLECSNRLECLMNIFEHELIHFIIQITHGHIKADPIYKSHGKLFKQLVYTYFGHTETKHSLLHNLEKVGKKEDFKLDDIVTYKNKNGEMCTGKIIKLNPKRAIIGNHSVPYTILKHSTKNIEIPKETNKTVLFNVGDIVSYTINGITETNKILKVNSKTYNVGKYRISHSLARNPTNLETCSNAKTRNDFYVGQLVSFQTNNGETIKGNITKLNPSKAVIGNYSVPYFMLN